MSFILCKYIVIMYFFLFVNTALLFYQQGLALVDLIRITLVMCSLSLFVTMLTAEIFGGEDDSRLVAAFEQADRSCMLALYVCVAGFVLSLPFATNSVLHWILFNVCVLTSCGTLIINKISQM